MFCRCSGSHYHSCFVDVQAQYGIYKYYALYTQVAHDDMYEFCSNVSAEAWPAIMDDHLVRVVGDAVRA